MIDGMEHKIPDQKIEKIPSTFFVDAECIENGRRENSRECMISLALLKAGCEFPLTGETVSFTYKKGRYRFKLEKDDWEKLADFDKGKTVEPFIIKAEPELWFKG